ncbi:hypothetical protein EMPS_08932 [Entomortierella parvispora]|uniref:RCC1-like domain-containing protein n=1 Tax=Entomortierella parvispora TaxID=205924 RepID=A0A9P3HHB3_9FUNG|nr:hypothetical protein EMPS_08932 [Entomortierella parvispora]
MPFVALGSNGNGQLGIGSDEDTPRPACVTASQNDELLVGAHSAATLSTSPFHAFAAGGNHSAIITRAPSRRLFMTGSNKDGETLFQVASFIFQAHDIEPDKQQDPPSRLNQHPIPDIDPQNQHIGDKSLHSWRAVACGWAFTVAITEPVFDEGLGHSSRERAQDRPQVFAWGSGSFGELGLGPGISKTGRKAIPVTLDTDLWSKEGVAVAYEATQIRAGLRHVLLLLTESTASSNAGEKKRTLLLGWGSNRQGQLGILERRGQGQQQPPLAEKELRGKFMEPARILLPISPAPSINDTPTVVDMACGQNHSLVLLSDGSVYSSGLDKYGQLGPREVSGTGRPPSQASGSKTDFRIGFERVQGLPPVDLISCGWNHNGAMNSQDRTRLYLWGRNDHGQLGNGTTLAAITTSDSSAIVVVRIPKSEQPDSPDKEFEEIESFSCGSEHCLAMTRSGDCYAWGWNEHGNCGTGPEGVDDRLDVLSPRKIHLSTSTSNPPSSSASGWVAGGYGSSWIVFP